LSPKTKHRRAVCAGVDWAKDDHAVCIVGDDGEALHRFMIKDNRAGLKDMFRQLLNAAVQEVEIERPDGTVVQALLTAGLTVLVIPPAGEEPAIPLRLRG